MIIETIKGVELDGAVINNYFRSLVNLFFKILPIWESGDGSVSTYMETLQSEVLGCRSLISTFNNDGRFLTLAAILQDLIDHPEYSHAKVRKTVFDAITVCNRLRASYFEEAEA